MMHLQTDLSAAQLLAPKASGAWKNTSASPVSLFPQRTHTHFRLNFLTAFSLVPPQKWEIPNYDTLSLLSVSLVLPC